MLQKLRQSDNRIKYIEFKQIKEYILVIVRRYCRQQRWFLGFMAEYTHETLRIFSESMYKKIVAAKPQNSSIDLGFLFSSKDQIDVSV